MLYCGSTNPFRLSEAVERSSPYSNVGAPVFVIDGPQRSSWAGRPALNFRRPSFVRPSAKAVDVRFAFWKNIVNDRVMDLKALSLPSFGRGNRGAGVGETAMSSDVRVRLDAHDGKLPHRQ